MRKKLKFLTYFIVIIFLLFLLYFFRISIFNFLLGVYRSFYRTLIEEERYILILNGLKSTILISFFSIIFGSIIGFLLFLLRRKNKLLKNLIKIMVSIIQGMPITVLLLIFYYVIFASIDIEPMIVAIITFSLYFSAYISEVFRGAYSSINKNQIISAYSLGFNKVQTLKYIIFPQLMSYIVPIFKNESVSLIKLTSIAGYISIMDLTKAGDIIRYRTYEAFFPLIFIALIYFVLCFIISKLLDLVYKKVNRRKEKRI